MAVDYGILFQGGAPQPLDSAVEGFKIGTGIQQLGLQKEKAVQEAAQQEQMRADMGALSRKPNAKAEDFAAMVVKYPSLSEHYKKGWDMLNAGQQASKLQSATQVYAAVNSGRNDIAIDLLKEQATAHRNAGNEKDAKAAEVMAEFITTAPEAAKTSVGLLLSSVMGPDKFAEAFAKLRGEARADDLHEPGLAEAKAKAHKAAIDARFHESNVVADLTKKGWDITKIIEDIGIGKENNRIAALNAAIGKEANEIRRKELQLKRDEAVQKRDETLRARTAEVENARFNIDNFLNTADRIIATPMNVVGAAAGPLSSKLPTTSQDTADFEALIENIDAQAFLSQIPQMKGAGALSDAEGKKLAAALQNFSLKQSPERLMENVKEAQRLMLKARKSLAAKYGIPDTVPDTPAAAAAAKPEEVSAILAKYGIGPGTR